MSAAMPTRHSVMQAVEGEVDELRQQLREAQQQILEAAEALQQQVHSCILIMCCGKP